MTQRQEDRNYVVIDGTAYPKSENTPSNSGKRKKKKRKSNVVYGRFARSKLKETNWMVIGLGLFTFGFAISGIQPGLASAIAWIGLIIVAARLIKRCWGRNQSWMSLLAWVFVSIFVLICLFMAYQSAHIYSDLFSSVGENHPIIDWGDLGAERAESVIIIGPLFAKLLRFLAEMLTNLELTGFGLVGIGVYFIVQTLEVLPMILRSIPEVMDSLITQLSKFQKKTLTGKESQALTNLIEEYNNYYESWLDGLTYAMYVAFVVDTIVCLWKAPIIKGGYGAWNVIKFTFGFGDIDYLNVVRILITVGFFSIIIWLLIQAAKGGYLFSGLNISDLQEKIKQKEGEA